MAYTVNDFKRDPWRMMIDDVHFFTPPNAWPSENGMDSDEIQAWLKRSEH